MCVFILFLNCLVIKVARACQCALKFRVIMRPWVCDRFLSERLASTRRSLQEMSPQHRHMVGSHDEPLYDRSLLDKVDFNPIREMFKPYITVNQPGPGLLVRPLQPSDYDKGFVELLGQLTDTGKPSRKDFIDKLELMKRCPDTYYVTVIEDTNLGRIIGAATLFVEHKFIHGCAKRGHLEDVVVNNTYRGKQLGKLIVMTVTMLAQTLGCYKMSLECKDKLIPFYNSLGYSLEPGNGNSMVQRFTVGPL